MDTKPQKMRLIWMSCAAWVQMKQKGGSGTGLDIGHGGDTCFLKISAIYFASIPSIHFENLHRLQSFVTQRRLKARGKSLRV
jgi:hypothetical protein